MQYGVQVLPRQAMYYSKASQSTLIFNPNADFLESNCCAATKFFQDWPSTLNPQPETSNALFGGSVFW